MDNYDTARLKAIQLLEKYNFNKARLDDYKNVKRGDNLTIDEVIEILGDGEEEILRYIKCNKLKDLSREFDATDFEVCLTWDESGM